MRVLFFYTRLSPYLANCIKLLATRAEQVHIVHYRASQSAPFEFQLPHNVHVYCRKGLNHKSLKRLARQIDPHLVAISGWRDLGYLRTSTIFGAHIPVVLLMDNQWRGTLRQKIWCKMSPYILKQIFTHCWVPGHRQVIYANRLGFSGTELLQHFYTADTSLFGSYSGYRTECSVYPKRFLYVGRYNYHKGLDRLLKVFKELKEGNDNEWEMWCVGDTKNAYTSVVHPKITHWGFIPQESYSPILQQGGVFVLPSRYEPWGVVIQEMASAAFPIVASSEVGSGNDYVREGVNGYVFSTMSDEALKDALHRIMELDDSSLKAMATHSHQLGMKHTPEEWVDTIERLAKGKR